jgi:eukaryotic-like serine/threonine-protein kinase
MSEVEQYQRAKDIFLHAIEVKPHERDAFLAKACGSDAELRREVEQLLRFHDDEHAGDTAARANGPVAGDRAKDETQTSPMSHDDVSRAIHEAKNLPKEIGGYRIIREIGRGGMGNVYLGVREDGNLPPLRRGQGRQARHGQR